MTYEEKLLRQVEDLATAMYQQENPDCWCEITLSNDDKELRLILINGDTKPTTAIARYLFSEIELVDETGGDKPEDWLRYIKPKDESFKCLVEVVDNKFLNVTTLFSKYCHVRAANFALEYTPFQVVNKDNSGWIKAFELKDKSNKYLSIQVTDSGMYIANVIGLDTFQIDYKEI